MAAACANILPWECYFPWMCINTETFFKWLVAFVPRCLWTPRDRNHGELERVHSNAFKTHQYLLCLVPITQECLCMQAHFTVANYGLPALQGDFLTIPPTRRTPC